MSYRGRSVPGDRNGRQHIYGSALPHDQSSQISQSSLYQASHYPYNMSQVRDSLPMNDHNSREPIEMFYTAQSQQHNSPQYTIQDRVPSQPNVSEDKEGQMVYVAKMTFSKNDVRTSSEARMSCRLIRFLQNDTSRFLVVNYSTDLHPDQLRSLVQDHMNKGVQHGRAT